VVSAAVVVVVVVAADVVVVPPDSCAVHSAPDNPGSPPPPPPPRGRGQGPEGRLTPHIDMWNAVVRGYCRAKRLTDARAVVRYHPAAAPAPRTAKKRATRTKTGGDDWVKFKTCHNRECGGFWFCQM